jgi:hypothetical protein
LDLEERICDPDLDVASLGEEGLVEGTGPLALAVLELEVDPGLDVLKK